MSTTRRQERAARRRVPVYLNLPELEVLLKAISEGSGWHPPADQRRATRRLERKRDSRVRAVARAKRRDERGSWW